MMKRQETKDKKDRKQKTKRQETKDEKAGNKRRKGRRQKMKRQETKDEKAESAMPLQPFDNTKEL